MSEYVAYYVRYRMHWGHKLASRDGQTDVTREEYNAAFGVESPPCPEMPSCALPAWQHWQRMSARRQRGDQMQPIGFEQMRNFEAMTGVLLSPEDVQMIEAIDDAFVRAVETERSGARDRMKQQTGSNKGKRRG